jgi:hypothetical protein
MSLSERYQERRDQLLEFLELTMLDKRFVELCWRNNLAAKQVAHLVSQYCEAETSSERSSLLRLLIEDAIPRLRLAVEAAALSVPAGYMLLHEQQVKALRSLAEQVAVVVNTPAQERAKAIFILGQRLEVVDNLYQPTKAVS